MGNIHTKRHRGQKSGVYLTDIEREARNKNAPRLLSRPGPEFSAQKPHGAKKPAEKGGIWIVCAEGEQINTVKNPQILSESLCFSSAPLQNPPVNFHTHHKCSYRKGRNKQEEENIRVEGRE